VVTPKGNSIVRSRWAPTPSGFLHVGNAFNFLITWLITRQQNGILRLRIDDLDQARCRQEYLEDIFLTLDWLGVDWDEGPFGVEEHVEKFSQSLRIPAYEEILSTLKTKGKLFACTCSRKEIMAASPNGLYPGTCLHKGLPFEGEGRSWRMSMSEDTQVSWEDKWMGNQSVRLHEASGAPVLRRKDGIPAYHVASVSDDLFYGINLIVRGEDLKLSTALQLALAEKIGAQAFSLAVFLHHPLLLGPEGKKLSKSKGALAIRTLREKNGGRAHFFQAFTKAMGWEGKPTTVQEVQAMYNHHGTFPRKLGYLMFT